MESSPSIEEDVLILFEKTFGNVFKDGFEKPEICNSLVSVKKIIYKKTDEERKKDMMKDIVGDIMMVQTEHQGTKTKIIKDFYERFVAELQRSPTKQELLDNLNELAITEDEILTYLEKNI